MHAGVEQLRLAGHISGRPQIARNPRDAMFLVQVVAVVIEAVRRALPGASAMVGIALVIVGVAVVNHPRAEPPPVAGNSNSSPRNRQMVTSPCSSSAQPGLWATSHTYPSGSANAPVVPPQSARAAGRLIVAPARSASARTSLTWSGECTL